MKLSILICSLENRKSMLEKLLAVLESQKTEDVEILINIDNKEKTVGRKRNELLLSAKGDYIAFVDDDDLVSNNYVSKILEAIKESPDCVGIEGTFFIEGDPKIRNLFHSLKYKQWSSDKTNYYRYPNHLNPVKRTIALQVGFKDINAGEDGDYSDKLLPFLKVEKYICEPIYYYYYSPTGSETNIRKNGLRYRNAIGGDFVMTFLVRTSSCILKNSCFNYGEEKIFFSCPNSNIYIEKANTIYIKISQNNLFQVSRIKNEIVFELNNKIIKKIEYNKITFPFSFCCDSGFKISRFDLVIDGQIWTRPW